MREKLDLWPAEIDEMLQEIVETWQQLLEASKQHAEQTEAAQQPEPLAGHRALIDLEPHEDYIETP